MNVFLTKVLCVVAHGFKRDKSGDFCFSHPLRIAKQCSDPTYKKVALLHDLLDHTWVSYRVLHLLCSEEVSAIVWYLTRYPGEDYLHYIESLRHNKIAWRIKQLDLLDTLNNGLEYLPFSVREQYDRALWLLR